MGKQQIIFPDEGDSKKQTTEIRYIDYLAESNRDMFKQFVIECIRDKNIKSIEERLDSIEDISIRRLYRKVYYSVRLEDIELTAQERWFYQFQIELISKELGEPILNEEIEYQISDPLVSQAESLLNSKSPVEVKLNTTNKSLSLRNSSSSVDYSNVDEKEEILLGLWTSLKVLDQAFPDNISGLQIMAEVLEALSAKRNFEIEYYKSGLNDYIRKKCNRVLIILDSLNGRFGAVGEKDVETAEEIIKYFIKNLRRINNCLRVMNFTNSETITIIQYIQRQFLEFLQKDVQEIWDASGRTVIFHEGNLIWNPEVPYMVDMIIHHFRKVEHYFQDELIDEFSARRNLEAIIHALGISYILTKMPESLFTVKFSNLLNSDELKNVRKFILELQNQDRVEDVIES